jgi:non-homologous end joining protein Ku
MRGKEMVALARVVISKRERAIMLEAFERIAGDHAALSL